MTKAASAPLRTAGEGLPPLLSLLRVYEDARACLAQAARAEGLETVAHELEQVDLARLRQVLSTRGTGSPFSPAIKYGGSRSVAHRG